MPLRLRPEPILRCGPLVRFVSRDTAVIWLEVAAPMEVEVQLWARRASVGIPISARASTVQVGGTHYVWIPCTWLVPDTWYSYRLIGHQRGRPPATLWPNPILVPGMPDSFFRTMPSWSLDPLRMIYGSCRKGFPRGDIRTVEAGPDGLEALARRLRREVGHAGNRWPHLLILMGDQIYGDDISATEARKSHQSVATTLLNFCDLYREAWTSNPSVRWLLSTLPSFMIFDDHEILDDWNITSAWVASHRSPEWVKRLGAGLLAYWLYQGAGNLSPKQWSSDERMRLLAPRLASLQTDITDRATRLFEAYIKGTRRTSWGYSFDAAGTRVVVGDTRMSRKLTGKRLLADDIAWSEFASAAKSSISRRVLLIVPGPYLLPVPMHDLYSWIADKIENDPGFFERLATGVAGGVVGGTGGALAGGAVGFVLGGPPGAVAGAAIGGGIGAAAGFGAGFFLEEIVESQVAKQIVDKDVELWPAFPSSFNRMTKLIEELGDGVGTVRKHFIAVLAGDVHFSYGMRADLPLTHMHTPAWHLTMSPIRNQISDPHDIDAIKRICTGDDSVSATLQWLRRLGILYRPDFVNNQIRHIRWVPMNRTGSPADVEKADDWLWFGNLIGGIEFRGHTTEWWYREVEDNDTWRNELERLRFRVVTV